MISLPTTASLKENKLPFLLFFFFEIVVIAFCVYDESPLLVLAALIALAIFTWSFFSVQRTFYLLALYISILPSYASYLRYTYLKFWVLLEVVAAIIFVMFFYDVSQRVVKGQKIFFQRLTTMDKAVAAFLVWSIFSALWGLVNGGDVKYVYTEFYFFSLYIVYFLIRRNFRDADDLETLWLVFTVISVLVSFEYIYIAFRETGLGTGILIKRVSTQQPHLAQLIFPYLMSYLLFKSDTTHKKLIIAALIPTFLMIFFSQQRGLWVGILFSTLLLWGLAFIREGASVKNFLRFLSFLLMAVLFITGMGWLIDKFFFGSTILTLVDRFNTLLELAGDASLRIRMGEIHRAMDQWYDLPIIGTGFGATINPILLEHFSINLVDNSFVVLLWKSGIVGLAIYLSMILIFFNRGLYIFKHTQKVDTQRMVAALLAGFAGLLVIALTNSCLVYYRFNIFWAMTLATIELLYWREKKNQQDIPCSTS